MPEAAVDASNPEAGLPMARCTDGTAWSEGMPSFREVTAEWGLTAMEVRGYRLNVVDIDGDGYPDLWVRLGGDEENFAPGERRKRWLLRNTGEGRFEDVTESSGVLAIRGSASGTRLGRTGEVTASADVNNDGNIDMFIAANVDDAFGDGARSEVMLGQGDGTFVLGPEASELRRQEWRTHAAGLSFVDIDRDGFIDLWMAQNKMGSRESPFQDALYMGAADAMFREATESSGLITRSWDAVTRDDMNNARMNSWAWSSAACDLNGDGTPELLAASYGRTPNHLWLGERDDAGAVRYTNRSVASGYAYDERSDWSVDESARCFCKLNRTAEGCAEVPLPRVRCNSASDILRWDHAQSREPFRLGGNSGSTTCADIDNDGDIDLVTGEIVHWDVGACSDPAEILLNTGEAEVRFERPGNEVTGLERSYDIETWNEGIMTQAVLDFDNDGWQDIYLGDSDYPGTRGLLYRQDSPGHFVSVPVDNFFMHSRSHGVVPADIDRDGDLDLIVGNSRSRCSGSSGADCYEQPRVRIFENTLGQGGNWIQLRLEGAAGTNRSAIGARVSVTANGVTQTQEVDGGHGHYGSQSDLVLHFGLGTACEAEVQIRWPNAELSESSLTLPAGHAFHVHQDSGASLMMSSTN
jgi:hypothetical protein